VARITTPGWTEITHNPPFYLDFSAGALIRTLNPGFACRKNILSENLQKNNMSHDMPSQEGCYYELNPGCDCKKRITEMRKIQ